jgi:large subunit ribosomal protein L15
MTITLSSIADNKGARKVKRVKGRGIGSGKGKTAGVGVKGQKARSGVAIKGFEGGQMPIYRRLPKRGFNNPTRKEFEALNFGKLQEFIEAKKLDAKGTITLKALEEAGLIRGNKDGVKLLAKGELTSKITIEVHAASKAAQAAVEKVGGALVIVNDRERRAEEAAAAKKENGAKPAAKAAKKEKAKGKASAKKKAAA